MGRSVNDGEHEHGVGDLTMEPYRLIEGQPSDLRPDDSKNVSAHGHNDHHGVDGQYETGTSRYPHGKLKTIKRRQALITLLFPPVTLVSDTGIAIRSDIAYHPMAKIPQWKPQKRM
jgi:hypothetical protein